LIVTDIPAISKLMSIKGHNAFAPCRCCLIRGSLAPGTTTYYVPLHAPDRGGRHWDPTSLPPRSHASFHDHFTQIQSQHAKVDRAEHSKHYGINGLSILYQLSSLGFPASFPYDFMHLIFENLCPNLVRFWTGKFKGLDEGTEDYEISPAVWEAIGEETASSIQYIPSAFVRSMPNIATDQHMFTAEDWSFWFVYMAPLLLHRRFQHPKYYKHLLLLVKIIKACLKFEISKAEVEIL
jgi:hypothetical protein